MHLLDTNVISELRKAKNADANVLAWAQQADASQLYISVITILELEQGILLKERKDRRQGAQLRAWFTDHVMPAFSNNVLPVDTAVALRCAKLHVPDPRSERDALIGATAIAHQMPLITRNTQDFQHMPDIILVNPWSQS